MSEQSTILRSLKPFLLLAKIFGIFGCSVSGDRVKKSSTFGTLYTVSWIFVTCYYIGYIDANTTNVVQMIATTIETRSYKSLEKFALIGGAIFVAILQQRTTIRYFDRMDDYDRRVRNLGFRREDETRMYWIMCLVPGLIAASREFWKFVSNDRSPTSRQILVFYYYDLMQYFIVMKLCMFIHAIYQRFRFMNESVIKRVLRGGVAHRNESVTVYDVRYLHTKLCEAGQSLIDIYSPFVLVWVFQASKIIAYFAQVFATSGDLPNFIVFIIVWVISLCWNCGIASTEASKVTTTLLEARPLSGDTADIMDRTEVAMYLCNHELVFTAGNIYVVNRPFLIQLAGIIVTYVTYSLS